MDNLKEPVNLRNKNHLFWLILGLLLFATIPVTTYLVLNSNTAIPNNNQAASTNYATGSAKIASDSAKAKSITSCEIQSPENGSAVSGVVIIRVGLVSSVGFTNWKVYLDDSLILGNELSTTTIGYSWNTSNSANGEHFIRCNLTDANGNTASDASKVTVTNQYQATSSASLDIVKPNCWFTKPANGASVSGKIIVAVGLSDNKGFTDWDAQIDGKVVLGNKLNSITIGYTWDTTQYQNGQHTLSCHITDSAGNSNSSSVKATVSN